MGWSEKTRGAPPWLGGLFIALGGFVILIAAGVIPVDPDSIKAPHWVLAMAGLVFALGGAMALPGGSDGWVNELLAILMVASLGAVSFWAAFGPGEREGTVSGSLGPVSVGGSGSPALGRAVFAVGSVLMVGLLLFMIHRYIKQLGRRS